jgi:hypothetical protein
MWLEYIKFLPLFVFFLIVLIVFVYYLFLLYLGIQFRRYARRAGLNYNPQSFLNFPSLMGRFEDRGLFVGVGSKGKEKKKYLMIKFFADCKTERKPIVIINKKGSFCYSEKVPLNIKNSIESIEGIKIVEIRSGQIVFGFSLFLMRKEKFLKILYKLSKISNKIEIFLKKKK